MKKGEIWRERNTKYRVKIVGIIKDKKTVDTRTNEETFSDWLILLPIDYDPDEHMGDCDFWMERHNFVKQYDKDYDESR